MNVLRERLHKVHIELKMTQTCSMKSTVSFFGSVGSLLARNQLVNKRIPESKEYEGLDVLSSSSS